MPLKKINKVFFFALALSLYSCYEEPRKFIAPKNEFDFSVPLFSEIYVLRDLIQDTLVNDVSFYESGEYKGVLYYKKTENFPAIRVEKEAKIRLRESHFNLFISDFDLGIEASPISIPLSDIISLAPGSYPSIPPVPTVQINKSHSIFSDINYIIFDDNSFLTLEFQNNTNLLFVIENVEIKNSGESFPIILEESSISLSPGEKKAQNYNVSNKIINKQIEITVKVSSPGSSSQVLISAQDNISVKPILDNSSILEIQGNFSGSRQIQTRLNHIVSDSTFFRLVTIDEGDFYFIIDNQTPFDFSGNILVDNLYTPSNQKYTNTILINSKSKNSIALNLNNHKFESPNLTNIVPIDLDLTATFPNNIITISKLDSIKVTIGSQVIIFNFFDGKLKPTILDNSIGTSLNMSFGKYFYKIGFDSLDIFAPKFSALVNASSDGEIKFGGILYAMNPTGAISSLTIPMTLASKYMPATIVPNINESREFVRNFGSQPPDSFVVVAQGILNPRYQESKYSRFDSLYGSITVELPAIVALKNGYFIDTIRIWSNISDENQRKINDFKYAELVVEFENYFGVQFIGKCIVADSALNPLFRLPIDQDRDSILILSANVDDNGNRIKTTITKTSVVIGEEQISKIKNIRNLLIRFRIDTYDKGYKFAKFKEDDKIKVRSYVRFKYFFDYDNFK